MHDESLNWLYKKLPRGYKDSENDKENLKIFLDLRDHIMKGDNIVPFVGAGVSTTFDAPTWKSFLLKMIKIFDEEHSIREEINKKLEDEDFESVAEELYDEDPELFEKSIQIHFKKNIDFNQKLFGESALPQIIDISTHTIVTTNFDDTLNRGLNLKQKNFDICLPQQDILKKAVGRFRNNEQILIHLHGTWSSSDSRVLTRKKYFEYYLKDNGDINFNKNLPFLLQSIASNSIFLFMGCSLQVDRTLQVLKKVFSKIPLLDHYAFMPAIDKGSDELNQNYAKKTKKRLSDAGIRVIWYPLRRNKGKSSHVNLKILLKILCNDQSSLELKDNGSKLNNPHAHHSIFIYEKLRRAQSTTRHSWSATDYMEFATNLLKTDYLQSQVVWTMNGSPLGVDESLLGDEKLSSQDIDFMEMPAEEKYRIVVFEGLDGCYGFLDPNSESDKLRKKSFINSIRNGNAKLIYATRKSLSQINIRRYLDIGFLSPLNGSNGIFFCSTINSEDLKAEHSAFSASKRHDVIVFSELGTPNIPNEWIAFEENEYKPIYDIFSIHEQIPSIIKQMHNKVPGGFYSSIEQLIKWEEKQEK